MTDETPQEELRLSKFSNADRLLYNRHVEETAKALLAQQQQGGRPPAYGIGAEEPRHERPLEEMLETVMRTDPSDDLPETEADAEHQAARIEKPNAPSIQYSRYQPEPPQIYEDMEPEQSQPAAPSKLFDELTAAQTWVEPQPSQPVDRFSFLQVEAFSLPPNPSPSFGGQEPAATSNTLPAIVSQIRTSASRSLVPLRDKVSSFDSAKWKRRILATAGVTARIIRRSPSFTVGKIRTARRYYYNAAMVFHRRVGDRSIERMLFEKSGLVSPFADALNKSDKHPHYSGPIPKAAFGWAMAGLPGDLRGYAFIDFRADNGRTLLLATAYGFDYAIGYAFDESSFNALQLNVAQFPRSKMVCRDVRPVRGDVDGVTIPPQPLVLFFGDSLIESHLEIVIGHVAASYRLNPRPIHLIFENLKQDVVRPYADAFARVPLPLSPRIKTMLFNPAKTRFYRSLV